MSVCVYVCMYVCMYVCIYVCLKFYERIYIYIYTHYRYIDRFRTVGELHIDLTGMMFRMLGIIPERSYSIYFEVGELL